MRNLQVNGERLWARLTEWEVIAESRRIACQAGMTAKRNGRGDARLPLRL
jgi:hypothetical protein